MNRTREERIENLMRYCIHYTRDVVTTGTACCKAGVNPRTINGGILKGAPCIDGHMNGAATRCGRWVRVSQEQAEIDVDRFDRAMAATLKGMAIAQEWRTRKKPLADRVEVVPCPACEANLRLVQFALNGHVHGKCETPDCVNFVE